MKLYVIKHDGSGKVFLKTIAPTREALARQIGAKIFSADGFTYNINQVLAEKASDNTSLGMLVGGLIGALGGGVGVAAGGVIGGLLGKEQDKKEEAEVSEFNRSVS